NDNALPKPDTCENSDKACCLVIHVTLAISLSACKMWTKLAICLSELSALINKLISAASVKPSLICCTFLTSKCNVVGKVKLTPSTAIVNNDADGVRHNSPKLNNAWRK